ncbi:MAG: DUF6247 family protein [Pseudonocardiaceae bacterium]
MSVATTKVACSGSAIRAALADPAPDACALFEAELQQAMGRASETFELTALDAVLDHWWGIATIRANPLSEQEHAQLARARTGDYTGLIATSTETGSGCRSTGRRDTATESPSPAVWSALQSLMTSSPGTSS